MRFTFRRVLPVAAALVVALAALSAADSAGTVSGKLRERGGAVIPDAFVLIHADWTGMIGLPRPEDRTVRSDARGRFRAAVGPGWYDVCVMSEAFIPECRKVRVKDGGTVDLDFQLKIDSRVLGEFADRFTGR
jgi:hypothetical protein